jgi:hypothetical protein
MGIMLPGDDFYEPRRKKNVSQRLLAGVEKAQLLRPENIGKFLSLRDSI